MHINEVFIKYLIECVLYIISHISEIHFRNKVGTTFKSKSVG